MTNEEKAKEIAELHEIIYSVHDKYNDVYDETSFEECYGSALQMAEWKDEYYKALLDLLVKSGADANIITDYVKNFYLVK